jgi:hypothetical protein
MLALFVQLGLSPRSVRAQSNTKDAGPEVWRMTIHPQAPSAPALRYALLPEAASQTPGNGAATYMLAFGRADQVRFDPTGTGSAPTQGAAVPPGEDGLTYYLGDVPLEKLPIDDVEGLMAGWAGPISLLEVAAHRDYCRWDLALREQGYEMLLPHLNPARQLGRAVALRARLHLARKEYPAAAEDIRLVMRLGRDLASEGAIVQTLVGASIASIGAGEVREYVQRPGAPNLYWPLAHLPRPLMDARAALEWERVGLLGSLPQLKKAETQALTADDWRDFVERLAHLGSVLGDAHGALGRAADAPGLAPAVAGAMLYPEAKRALVERGVIADAAAVESMPVPEVLGKYLVNEYRTWFDEVSKWTAAPFWQAHDRMRRAEADLAKTKGRPILSPMLAGVPAVSKFSLQLARLDRQLAMLQTIEALRAYAAAHDSKLPASLGDLDATDTPAAQDPTTGKPFAYRVEADARRATLESPAPAGESPKNALRVEVALEK